MNKRSVRSPFLRAIQKAFILSRKSAQPATPPLDELIEQSRDGMARRKFIGDITRAGIFVGIAGILESCRKDDFLSDGDNHNLLKKKPGGIQPRIAIIGGGLAGLNCAFQLAKKGRYATIYEGSDRVGGRVITKQNLIAPGTYSECGGEFVDTGHKHMKALAAELGLLLLDTDAPAESTYLNDTFYVDGKHYTEAEVIAAFGPYADTIFHDVQSLPTHFDFSNYTPAVLHFDQMSISGYFDSIGMPSGSFLRKGLEQAYLTEYGREVNDQTAINFLFLFSINPGNNNYDIFGLSDERYKVAGGNERVPVELANRLSGQIALNRKLVKISISNSNVYTLWFENGPSVQADIVVITLPFSVLRHVDLTELSLPDWKTNAIENLGYGTNSKLLLGFNQKVWRNYGHSGGVFTNGTGQNSAQFIQTGWDGTRLQSGSKGGYTVFQGGNQGASLSLDQTQTMVNQLESMWPGSAAAFNGISKLIHWPSHPWTQASYSCWRVGQATTIMGAEILPVGNLFFAGEHCSAWYQGYMEGAAETGATVAKNILIAV